MDDTPPSASLLPPSATLHVADSPAGRCWLVGKSAFARTRRCAA